MRMDVPRVVPDIGVKKRFGHAFKTLQGRGPKKNEDAFAQVPGLISVSRARLKEFLKGGVPDTGVEPYEKVQGERFDGFFVGDGHNGWQASRFCAQFLLSNIAKVYSEIIARTGELGLEGAEEKAEMGLEEEEEGLGLESGRQSWSSDAQNNGIGGGDYGVDDVNMFPSAEVVFREAFRRTDSQYALYSAAARSTGTTALVALVSDSHLCIGSCGDSRAVLYRSGQPVLETALHKLSCPEEKARILQHGGAVENSRVMGILDMSRAIGGNYLREQGVIPDPDVLTLKREVGDEYLVMATDGLWDVMGSEEVYSVLCTAIDAAAAKNFHREKTLVKGIESLCRQALDRGSQDNITVVIVDLKPTIQQQEAGQCADICVHNHGANT